MATYSAQIPKLPEVQRLSPSIIRILGGNPSKYTLQGTNTYLLGRGPTRLLLDTGEGKPSWSTNLSSVLKEQSATISTCILSHWHHDHTEGVPALLELCPKVTIYKHSPERGQSGIQDGQIFEAGDSGLKLRALHCPGHTTDHVALIVKESPKDEKDVFGAIFTGDNVLGHGTAVFEDLKAYIESLHRMNREIGEGAMAFPAHGDVIADGKRRVVEYIKHRQQREDEVLRVLQTGRADDRDQSGLENVIGKEWESMAIVKVIYHDVPESLHEPAEKGVLQVLRKLAEEGKVSNTKDGSRWTMSERAVI